MVFNMLQLSTSSQPAGMFSFWRSKNGMGWNQDAQWIVLPSACGRTRYQGKLQSFVMTKGSGKLGMGIIMIILWSWSWSWSFWVLSESYCLSCVREVFTCCYLFFFCFPDSMCLLSFCHFIWRVFGVRKCKCLCICSWDKPWKNVLSRIV